MILKIYKYMKTKKIIKKIGLSKSNLTFSSSIDVFLDFFSDLSFLDFSKIKNKKCGQDEWWRFKAFKSIFLINKKAWNDENTFITVKFN